MCCVATVLQEGCTALHVACSYHSVEAALYLLNAHIAVDLLDNVSSILFVKIITVVIHKFILYSMTRKLSQIATNFVF